MWSDIPGHTAVKDILGRYCSDGRIPHALLFAGPLGIGKTKVAIEFFKALNCEEPGVEACGRCPSCVKTSSGNHPDVSVVNPEKRWIRIDEDIRPLIADIGLKPFEGRMRCVLVEPAESLTTESANALLKTLEEPPPQTVIVLVSHRPALVLPTVVSRCRVIRFTGPDAEHAASTRGETVAGTSPGTPVDHAVRDDVLGLLAGLDPVDLAGKYSGEDGAAVIQDVLAAAESVVRDLLVLTLGSGGLVNERLGTMGLRLPELGEIDEILAVVSEIRRGSHENVNVRASTAELFIRLARLAAP